MNKLTSEHKERTMENMTVSKKNESLKQLVRVSRDIIDWFEGEGFQYDAELREALYAVIKEHGGELDNICPTCYTPDCKAKYCLR